jgi:organic radical activating enzyme
MKVKGIVDEDFVNYKKPSMFIIFPYCTFKCDKEAGCQVCQNSDLANSPIIEMNNDEIIKRYLDNPITEAVVIGGLEPFDTFEELYQFIKDFRRKSNDDIIIYTGYYPEEISEKIRQLSLFLNIIIKFGRFIPNQKPHYDIVLGIELASDNQEAIRMEDLI